MMNNLSKKEVREAVREALSNAHIPSENVVRKIVQEEIQKQKDLEEQKEKQGVLEEMGKFSKSPNKWKRILKYVLLFILIGVTCILITVLSTMIGKVSKIISIPFEKKAIYFFMVIFLLALSTIVMFFALLLYDKMKVENHKYVKAVFITMILMWVQMVDPDLLEILQNIF